MEAYSKSSDVNAHPVQAGPFLVTGGVEGSDFAFRPEERRLDILSETPLILSNLEPRPTDAAIYVAKDISAHLTLEGVWIVAFPERCAALHIAEDSTGDVTVLLAVDSDNSLVSGPGRAGLEKSGDTGSLFIGGSGALTAQGGNGGAGIGGGRGKNARNITINGGIITAEGGEEAACIGGGESLNYTGGPGGIGTGIVINGGIITAVTDSVETHAWGIGCGNGVMEPERTSITINGGVVTANGLGGQDAEVLVRGGAVTVLGPSSEIVVTGGSVTADPDYYPRAPLLPERPDGGDCPF